MIQAGLVLEGGGMRGAFTAGVTDFFLDKGMIFSDVYGVSAGSCVACSYLSKQRRRAYRVMSEFLDGKDYCSWRNVIKTGDMFGVDFCYNVIPNPLIPYDHDEYAKYEGRFYAVATDVDTGEAAYLQVKDMRTDMNAVRASSSLPLVSRIVRINGKRYLDGGVADSIPVRRALEDGLKKVVVVLTREDGYVKKKSSTLPALAIRYRKDPAFIECARNRHVNYNESLDAVRAGVEAGTVFVLQPPVPVAIKRTEKDLKKLEALYQQGYDTAELYYDEMMDFLQK